MALPRNLDWLGRALFFPQCDSLPSVVGEQILVDAYTPMDSWGRQMTLDPLVWFPFYVTR